MSKRTDASTTELMWPLALRRPSASTKLIYLDLNHWINLAQAVTGHSEGLQYMPVLQACRAARAAGTALFPLSASLYTEVSKITDPAQRSDLAELMEELSGFTSLLTVTAVTDLELDAALTARLGPSPNPPSAVDLLGPGHGWAVGKLYPLRIFGPNGDMTEQVRQQMGPQEFDALMGEMELFTERMMLAGPSDEDLPSVRALGWDPLAAHRVAQERADREQSFQNTLSDENRRRPGKLRDLVLLREAATELKPKFLRAIAARDCSISEVLGGDDPNVLRALGHSMPTVEIAVSLKVKDHQNKSKAWTSNDIFDIDALSLAVPYCDIVVTDAHRCHVLRSTHLDQRMKTVVLAKTIKILDHL